MTPEIIGWVLTGVLAAFVLFGILWGLGRGLKRTAFRGVWLLVIAVILLFISAIITKSLMNINFGKLFNVSILDHKLTTLNETLSLILKDKLPVGSDTVAVAQLCVGLATMVINAFIFTLLFWLCKILLNPIYWILGSILFKKERKINKVVKENGKKKIVSDVVKVKKHRLLGGLVGAVLGLFICSVTLMPVIGYLNIARSVNDNTAKNSESGEGIIEENVGDTYTMITDAYDKSIFGTIYKYTGAEALTSILFDQSSKTKINNKTIYLTKEADVAVKIYDVVNKFEMIDYESCSQQEMAKFIIDMNKNVELAFNSGIVNAAVDTLTPIGVDIAQENLDLNDFPDYLRPLITNTLTNLKTFKGDSVKTEILGLFGLVKTLNDTNLLLPLLQNRVDDVLVFLQESLSKQSTSAVINKLFELKSVDVVAPDLVNAILTLTANQLGFEYEPVDTIASAELKVSLLNITSAAVDVLMKIDANSEYYIQSDGVSTIGVLIDAIKDSVLVTDEVYDDLVEKLEEKLVGVIDEAVGSDVPAFAINALKDCVANISEVTSFTQEFVKIQNVVNLIKDGIKDENGNNTSDVQKMNFSKLGEALDVLETTTMVSHGGNNIVKDAVIQAIDEYGDDMTIDDKKLNTFISATKVKSNITSAANINWKNDLTTLKNLVVSVKNIIDSEQDIMDQFKDESNTTVARLGSDLDYAKTTTLFGSGAVNLLVKDILSVAKGSFDPSNTAGVDDEVVAGIDSIDAKITEEANITWADEFNHLRKMVSIDFNADIDDFPAIGAKIDSIVYGEDKSNLIDEETVDTMILGMIDSYITDTSDFHDQIDEVKVAFSDQDTTDEVYTNLIESYENEFSVLKRTINLTNFNFSTPADAIVLGEEIDDIIVLNSVIVNEEFIDKYITDVMDTEFTGEDFATQLTTIKNAFSDQDTTDEVYTNSIDSYEVEFTALSKLLDLKDYCDGLDSAAFKSNAENIGGTIDTALAVTVVDDLGTTETDDDVTYHSNIITKKFVDDYIVTFINSAFNGATDANFAAKINEIKAKFYDTDPVTVGHQNAIINYKVEFNALGKLLDITDITSASDFDFAEDAADVGAAIDTALAVTVVDDLGTTETTDDVTYTSTIVTKTFINSYIKNTITDALPEGWTNGQFSNVVYNIIGNDDPVVASRLDNETYVYATEFAYLANFTNIINNAGTVNMNNVNSSIPALGDKTIGQRFDEVKGSVLIGDAGKNVVCGVLDTYATDNAEYGDIVTEIKVNVNNINLTAHEPYSTAFTNLASFKTTIDTMAEVDADDAEEDDEDVNPLDAQIASMQDNAIVGVNGAREIAEYTMNRIKDELTDVAGSYNLLDTTAAVTYISQYVQYLNRENPQNEEPYNSGILKTYTFTSGDYNGITIQVNNPFTFLKSLLPPIS